MLLFISPSIKNWLSFKLASLEDINLNEFLLLSGALAGLEFYWLIFYWLTLTFWKLLFWHDLSRSIINEGFEADLSLLYVVFVESSMDCPNLEELDIGLIFDYIGDEFDFYYIKFWGLLLLIEQEFKSFKFYLL